MVGKYIEQNCLHVKDPKAVNRLHKLLNSEPISTTSNVKCNKSHNEVTAFLSQIKKH
jgi:hypothetical protein